MGYETIRQFNNLNRIVDAHILTHNLSQYLKSKGFKTDYTLWNISSRRNKLIHRSDGLTAEIKIKVLPNFLYPYKAYKKGSIEVKVKPEEGAPNIVQLIKDYSLPERFLKK